MRSCELKIQTPRGTFNIHTIFESEAEARGAGWGLWFQHLNYLILGKDNCVGAVVLVGKGAERLEEDGSRERPC